MSEAKEGKHALMSKTIWMNMALALVAVLSAKFPEAGLQGYLNAENMALMFGFLNVVLRAVSKDKVFFF